MLPMVTGGGGRTTGAPRRRSSPRRSTGSSANAVEHRLSIKRSTPKRSTSRRSTPVRRSSSSSTSARRRYAQRVVQRRSSSNSGRRRSTPQRAPRRATAPKASTPRPRPAPRPKVAPKPAGPPGVNQYLQGDTTYQGQLAQLRKAYADYVASQNTDKTNYQNTYNLNAKNIGTDKTQAFTGLTDDYASRGLLQSGVYGKAYSDLQNDYTQRQAALDTQRSAYLSDLATNLATFRGDQATTTTSAKQEAIARRAAKYGLKV